VRRALLGVSGGRGSLQNHYRSRTLQALAVRDVVLHPEYPRDRRYNDIALLRLDRAATVTALVRPACLHTDQDGAEMGLRAEMCNGWARSTRSLSCARESDNPWVRGQATAVVF
jgi:hypothetical protein